MKRTLSLLAATTAALAMALPAGAGAAAPPAHPPKRLQPSRTLPVHGAHATRHLPKRLVRRAHSRALPPAFSRTTWTTGLAWCSHFGGNSITVYPPQATQYNGPAAGVFMTYWWRYTVYTWDATGNRWLTPQTSKWFQTNPIDDFAYGLGAYANDPAGYGVAGHNVYTYVMVQNWYHFTTSYDDAMWGRGGAWLGGESHYLRQASDGTLSNGACGFA